MAGACTVHFNRVYHREIRRESVQNAFDQVKIATATFSGMRRLIILCPGSDQISMVSNDRLQVYFRAMMKWQLEAISSRVAVLRFSI